MSEMVGRFWSKVEIRSDHECWPWGAGFGSNRSGIRYGTFRLKRMRKAHQVAWEIANGTPVPPGQVIRHSCDNGICCNPKHLVSGTQKQNVADRYDRGRDVHLRGEEHPNSKLTRELVLNIRKDLAKGHSQRKIAILYGVSQFGVRYARSGWKHV